MVLFQLLLTSPVLAPLLFPLLVRLKSPRRCAGDLKMGMMCVICHNINSQRSREATEKDGLVRNAISSVPSQSARARERDYSRNFAKWHDSVNALYDSMRIVFMKRFLQLKLSLKWEMMARGERQKAWLAMVESPTNGSEILFEWSHLNDEIVKRPDAPLLHSNLMKWLISGAILNVEHGCQNYVRFLHFASSSSSSGFQREKKRRTESNL